MKQILKSQNILKLFGEWGTKLNIKKVGFKDQIKSSLKLQIICYSLGSLFLGVVLFAFLGNVGHYILFRYLEPTWNDGEIDKDIAEFQKYVSDNEISSDQWEDISDWNGEKIYVLSTRQIESHGNQPHRRQNIIDREKDEWDSDVAQVMFPITYTDGVFQTWFLYTQPSSNLFLTVFACGIVSFAMFVFIFYLLLRRKLDYIREIESGISILEGGDLGCKIDVKGKDELGRLATSVNGMSESLSEKIEAEQRAVQSGREIIGDLSHDIRTPLTILSGYVPLLLESEPLTMKQREYLELIGRKTEQMSHRVNELLDYAVIYSGQRKPEKITLNVNTLVNQFYKELSPLDAIVTTDETPPDVFIDADPALLERVFDNILSNLHKHADPKREIRLICKITDNSLLIKVENAILTTDTSEGKSLGLKITAHIMESHGGSLTTTLKGDRFQTVLRFPLRIE